jgi:diguanylate cyclase (GGDEF)-like protein
MKDRRVRARTALVVDDGPVERLAGAAMLEKLNFVVTTASGGEEALGLLKAGRFDIVLCDISMPGMGGLELMEISRGHPRPPPFIISTSHDDAEHAFASLRSGAYGYLTKPLRFESLRDTVTEVLTKHSEEQEKARRDQALAQEDPLTSLMNRSEFGRRVARLLTLTPENCDRGAILLIKIKGLSHINHTYGRSEGNKVLLLAAEALSGLIRASDLASRFEGDIFALYLDGIAHSKVEEKAGDIVERIERIHMVLAGDSFSLVLTIGGACVCTGMEMENLLNHADFALHLARERSRKRIHIYSDADEVHKRELSSQLNTLALVRGALEHRERLTMHYQPIISLANGKVCHYEALLRLQDEKGKPCNAGELFKTCEVFGLVGRLDRAVVETCLDDVVKLPPGTGVAINLSGKSIGDPDLLHFIESRIEALAIDPSRIIFELTETAAFYNLDEVRHFVRRIKHLGCRFALDDFGVGFSSFYYIKELEFDYLKIDGSFIVNLPRNANDQVFVRAMVEISKVFGLIVIAEWVEDQETSMMLREFGVAFGQGYFFGKAAPLPESA